MLLKVALILLVVWFLGIVKVYDIGVGMHAFLLAGLMLLLFAFVRAHDAASRDLSR